MTCRYKHTNATNATLSCRLLWLTLALLAALPRAASSQGTVGGATSIKSAQPASLSSSDAELKHRFRGIGGGEQVIDGLVEMNRVALFNEKGHVIETGTFSPASRSTSSYGGDDWVVPKTVRMMWYSDDSLPTRNERAPPAFEGGTLLADVTVPVASRIPLQVLDEVRRGGGGLRLKMRVHPEGVLIGWDIERRLGAEKYTQKEIKEKQLYFPPVYFMTGGDFKEARGYYVGATRMEEKGWYLHPKTGKKIETAF